VGSLTRPFVAGVVKTDPPDPGKAAYTAGRGGPVPSVQGLSLLKPPYGRITAYDMNKGEIAWQVPNGDTPPAVKDALTKLGLTNMPPTGYPSQASFVVTKTLLIGGEGAGLTVAAGDLHLDYSKNRVTDETMRLLGVGGQR